MTRAQMQARRTGQSIKRDMTLMQRASTGAMSAMKTAALGIGVAVAGLGAALVTQGKAAFEWASNLNEAAAAAGVTVEQYQILSRAALENGASQETMARSLQILNRTLGQARAGVPAAVTAFRALRIDPEQFMNAGQVLPVVMERLRGLRTSSEQAAASQRLLGRSSAELLPFLAQGAEGYDKVATAARAAGLVTAEQAARADDAADKLALLAYQARTNLASALLSSMPAIEGMINGLMGIAQSAATAVSWLARLGGAVPRPGVSRDTASSVSTLARHGTRTAIAGALSSFGPMGTLLGAAIAPRADGTRQAAANSNDRPGIWGLLPEFPTIAPPGDVDLDLTNPSRGGKGRSGGSGDAERARQAALREAHDFQSSIRNHRLNLLRAQQDLLDSDQARYDLGRDIAEIERQQYVAEQTLAVQLGERTQQQAAELLAGYDAVAEAQLAADDREVFRQLAEERAEVSQQEFDLAAEALQREVDGAETSRERRDAELRLLDLTYRHEEAKLRAIVADETAERAARERAQRELDALPGRRAGDEASVRRNTMGPMESYLNSLPNTAAKANEALQRLQVQGLEGLLDSVLALSDGLDAAKKSLIDTAKEFLLGLQAGLSSLFGKGGFNFGGLFGGGKATGGPVVPGRFYVVGERGPELFAPNTSGTIIPNNDNATRMGAGGMTQVFNIATPDADSFRRSERQIARSAKRRLAV